MRLLGFVFWSAALTALACAQVRSGDVILCDRNSSAATNGHIVCVDRSTSVMKTVRSGSLPWASVGVGFIMARNNVDTYLIEQGGPAYRFCRVSPGGILSTIAVAGTSGEGDPTSCCLLQDGKVAITASIPGTADFLRILDPATGVRTSLYTARPSKAQFHDVRQNPDNGNLLVCSFAGSGLLEYDVRQATLRTICKAAGVLYSVDVEPTTGNFVATAPSGILVISPQGTILKTIITVAARRLRVEPSTGLYVCTTGWRSDANRVIEYDSRGTTIRLHGPYNGFNFAGLDLYGSNQVTGSGPATPGSTYLVDFCFPGSPNLNYVAALALGQRPGFRLKGATVNLALDPLFEASLQGLFVSGFRGNLDVSGRARGSIKIPAFVPRGLTIYCAAVATNGTVLLTGNTVGITIR